MFVLQLFRNGVKSDEEGCMWLYCYGLQGKLDFDFHNFGSNEVATILHSQSHTFNK